MPATLKLSIIVPTLNAEADLPETLDALLSGVAAGVLREVIISDGGSDDRSRYLADLAGAEIVTGPPGRGGQLNRGAQAARSDWFLFLHADTHLPPDWVGIVAQHAASSDKAAAFRLKFRAEGIPARFTAWFANTRSRVFGLPYGDQGLLISRALYDAVGGYPDQPLMEDVAMAKALRGQLVLLDAEVTTSAARYHRDGWMRRGLRNLWTLARYRLGASPEALARSYHKP